MKTKGFAFIIVGLVLVVLDFDLDFLIGESMRISVDMIPDIIGYVLLLIGAAVLSGAHRMFAHARSVAVGGLIVSLLGILTFPAPALTALMHLADGGVMLLFVLFYLKGNISLFSEYKMDKQTKTSKAFYILYLIFKTLGVGISVWMSFIGNPDDYSLTMLFLFYFLMITDFVLIMMISFFSIRARILLSSYIDNEE